MSNDGLHRTASNLSAVSLQLAQAAALAAPVSRVLTGDRDPGAYNADRERSKVVAPPKTGASGKSSTFNEDGKETLNDVEGDKKGERDGEDLEKARPSDDGGRPGDDGDDDDPNLVTWDGPDDPANPRNWPSRKKWIATGIVAGYTFISPLGSSIMAPALPEIAMKFGVTNSTVVALMLSIFLLAYAVGPLVLGPLSELYGRTWVLHYSNLFYLAFNLGCAWAPNTAAMILCRFFAGLGASAPLAVGGGTIGDLFEPRERAKAMATYSFGPLVGPVLGPIAGGFIAQYAGYRWLFWVLAMACGAFAVIGIIFLRETYAPILLARKAAHLRHSTGNQALRTAEEMGRGEGTKSASHVLWLNLTRPLALLVLSPICLVLSLYMAFLYGILYLLFVSFPDLFTITYGWSVGVSGLAYLGPGLGSLFATVAGGLLMDAIYRRLSAKNGGVGTPEMRIPVLSLGAVLVPVGLFWYGWSAQAHIHWVMPIIGAGIFSFGMMNSFLGVSLYLVDAFKYAASATAAATVLRSLFGFALPLCGEQMFRALTIGGGNSLLAGIAIIIGVPFPILIYFHGAKMRAKSDVNR